MVCIYCGSSTQVVNSRHQKQANQVWRRRKCLNPACKAIFTTNEQADLSKSLLVIDEPGAAGAQLLRELLFASIYEACKHREHAASDAAALTDTVLHALLKGGRAATVSKKEIARTTHAVLARFDQAAVAVYAAYHLRP
jgi:transcriptional regulator NrdR family protein